jgi:hypothetical protein
MKISKQTLSIVKNFSTINASLAVKPGSVLKTISPQNNIMASASVSEAFPVPFAIYDLNQFLGALSLFEDPDFEFGDQFVTISSGKNSVRYFYADESMIKTAGEKKITLPSVDVSFGVTSSQLSAILKASSVLGVPEVAVISDGSKLQLVAVDNKNTTSNRYAIDLDGEATGSFKVIFKAENLKLLPGDYAVEICSKGISRFASESLGVEVFIAIEQSSSFK